MPLHKIQKVGKESQEKKDFSRNLGRWAGVGVRHKYGNEKVNSSLN